MRTRTLTGLSGALAAAGFASTGIGLHVTHTPHPVIGGVALILIAVLVALAAHGRRATTLTSEQAAAERAAGYRQGLMHAAAGLLEPPSTRVDDTERTQQ